MNNNATPIIDLFAGPGGLGEGFSSVVDENNKRCFRIALSIERDEYAHKTLTLRSFLRQFPAGKFPDEYYQFLAAEITLDNLYSLYPEEIVKARSEAWRFSLGNSEDHGKIDKRIRTALNGEKDFLLIGGPPCQAYSLVGRSRRQEGNGLNKEDKRVFLYREYYRILAIHRPAVFIMENVKGILSSKVDNQSVFKQIINDLKKPVESYKKLQGKAEVKSKIRYKIYSLVLNSSSNDLIDGSPIFESKDYTIHAEKYGIPQARHRVILLGIRNDIDVKPDLLIQEKEMITIKSVLDGLPKLRSGLSKVKDDPTNWQKVLNEILASGIKNEIDIIVWRKIKDVLINLKLPENDKGHQFIPGKAEIGYNEKWYLDSNLKGVSNHESRAHIKEDLFRYLFVSSFASVYDRSPKLSEFPPILLPKHKNVKKGITENKFSDRFRAQTYNEPAKTITSHISKDGHYYIHPDPSQCRSLTVREAARIQTFPDNYFFCGPRTEQFHQVGNAVPPLLAYEIGKVVENIFRTL